MPHRAQGTNVRLTKHVQQLLSRLGLLVVLERSFIHSVKLQIDIESLLTGEIDPMRGAAGSQAESSDGTKESTTAFISIDLKHLWFCAPGVQLMLEGLHLEVNVIVSQLLPFRCV